MQIAPLVKAGGIIVSTDGTPPKHSLGSHIKMPRGIKHQLKLRQRRIAQTCKQNCVSIEYIFPYYTVC
jgi:hypothetical protein